MTKVLSFETSKRIAPYLDKEKIYENYWDSGARQDLKNEFGYGITEDGEYPALNLEEALEFLPKVIRLNKEYENELGYKFVGLSIHFWKNEYILFYGNISLRPDDFGIRELTPLKAYGETLLEAIDKMINHLLDNNLITIGEQ